MKKNSKNPFSGLINAGKACLAIAGIAFLAHHYTDVKEPETDNKALAKAQIENLTHTNDSIRQACVDNINDMYVELDILSTMADSQEKEKYKLASDSIRREIEQTQEQAVRELTANTMKIEHLAKQYELSR